MPRTSSLLTCPHDLLLLVIGLLEAADVLNLRQCGDRQMMARFASEPLLPELWANNCSSGIPYLSRLVKHCGAHLRVIKINLMLPEPRNLPTIPYWTSSLPPTLVEIDFAFIGSSTLWLQPLEPHESIHWTLVTPHHAYVPVNMGSRFPQLRILKLEDGNQLETTISFLPTSPTATRDLIKHYGSENKTFRNHSPGPISIKLCWTDFMFGLWVKLLPPSLTTLHLTTAFKPEIYAPYLPKNLEKLHIAPYPGKKYVWTERRFDPNPRTLVGEIPEALFSSLISFTYIGSLSRLDWDMPRFGQLQKLNLVSTKILGTQLHMLPQSLTSLALNCIDFGDSKYGTYTVAGQFRDLISLQDFSKLPRSISRLTLFLIAPLLSEDADFNFAELLPPNLVRLKMVTFVQSQYTGRGLSHFHLKSLGSSLPRLQHLVLEHVQPAFETLDWIPSVSLTTLKLKTRNPYTNVSCQTFDSLPLPCQLTKLVLVQKAAENVGPTIASKLPPTLTHLVLQVSGYWNQDDWKQFRSLCPPSLTRTHIITRNEQQPSYMYPIGLELPSSLETLSNSTRRRDPNLPSSSLFLWTQTYPEKAIISYLLPQTITTIDLKDVIVVATSPLLKLMNLVSLSIHGFGVSSPPEEEEEEEGEGNKKKKKPLRQREADQKLAIAMQPLSEALESLVHLSKLHLDASPLFWLQLAPLQQRLTDLSFHMSQVPKYISSLSKFTKLRYLDASAHLLNSSDTDSMTFKIWNSIPRSLTHLAINCAPCAGLPTTSKTNFPHLTSFNLRVGIVTQTSLPLFAPNITRLGVTQVMMVDLVGWYGGLNRDLLEFGDLEMVQSLCPSVTSLVKGFERKNDIILPRRITWSFKPKKEHEQVHCLKALPPNLTRLVWPHEWQASLGSYLPSNLVSLELTQQLVSPLDWTKASKTPETLKWLSIVFSDRRGFPLGFTAWLPRGLETLVSSRVISLGSDLEDLPPGIQRLILPSATLSSTLLSSKTSLTCLSLRSISEEAIESLPSSMKELQFVPVDTRFTGAVQSMLHLPLSYSPWPSPDMLGIRELSLKQLELA